MMEGINKNILEITIAQMIWPRCEETQETLKQQLEQRGRMRDGIREREKEKVRKMMLRKYENR